MTKRTTLWLAVLLLAFAAGPLAGQSVTGKIIGKVLDDQGAPLPGVSVEATGPRLVGKAVSVTSTDGAYRLLALPVGPYSVVFSLPGFKTVRRDDVRVALDQTLTLEIRMAPSAVTEEVTVVGQVPLVNVRSTTRETTMNRQTFTVLPRGRNFDSLLGTVPGVATFNFNDNTTGTSVDGASGAENMFYIDGINTTNIVNGVSAQQANFDFVEEVQFRSSGYNAEYGGSLGGVVNVLTRSGGNEFHGELLAYYNGQALTGTRRPVLNYNTADSTLSQYFPYEEYAGKDNWQKIEGGLNLGGYIFKDKLWFFGSFMPNYDYLSRKLDYAIQGRDLTRTIETKQVFWNGQAKITAQPFSKLRLNASVINNMRILRGPGLQGMGMPVSYTASATSDYNALGFNYPNFSASGMADLVLSNSFLVSLRGGYFRTNQNHQLPEPPTDPWYGFQADQPYQYIPTSNSLADWPEIPEAYRHIPNWSSYTRSKSMGTNKLAAMKVNGNLDISQYLNLAGEHAIKAGVQYIRQGEDVDNAAVVPNVRLAWNMNLVMNGIDYGRGRYGWYGVRANEAAGPYGDYYQAFSNQWAIYLQDTWTIGNRLTLNVGIRSESEYVPSYSQDPLYKDVIPVKFGFADKISPRLGFVYDMFGDSSLKVYGSYAIYQDVMKLNMASGALGGTKWKTAYYTLDDWDFTKIGVNGNYPGTYLTVKDWRVPAFDTVDPDMKPFTQREIALGVDKMLAENLVVSLRGVSKSVLNAIEDIGIVGPDGEEYYYSNPGSAWMNNKYQEKIDQGFMLPGTKMLPKAKREYMGLSISLDKRLSNNWLAGFSYTLSRLTGNYSGLANSDEAGRNAPNTNRSFDLWHFTWDKNLNPIDGPLATDRPHYLKAYGSYVFPFGLTIGMVAQAMSGTPVSESWNVEGPGYYPYGRANMGRTPFVVTADAYAEYTIRLGGRRSLQFNVNVINLFNADTATNIYAQRYLGNISPGDAALISANWSPAANEPLDPFFNKADTFLRPIQATLGVRLAF